MGAGDGPLPSSSAVSFMQNPHLQASTMPLFTLHGLDIDFAKSQASSMQ